MFPSGANRTDSTSAEKVDKGLTARYPGTENNDPVQMFNTISSHPFEVRLANGPGDVAAAQALRYQVFVQEGGAAGPMVDHAARIEADHFDAFADHLLLCDISLPADQQVVGTYRVMTSAQAKSAGGFYSASEFDLSSLTKSGRRTLELGRSCIHKSYRGGRALSLLWQGLGQYVATKQIDVLFGVGSFPGTNPAAHAQALSLLARDYRADGANVPVAAGAHAIDSSLLPSDQIDRRAALTSMPPLIKSYLRVGARVGEGAFVDHTFNTIDVCILLEAAHVSAGKRGVLEAAV